MIDVDISKCTGCRRCEVACGFYHSGRVGHQLSRIKVQHLYESGIDGPVVCVQCDERYCARCPHDAIKIGRWGEVVVSPTTCKLCGACERACPIGAIEIFEEIPVACDLCAGRPRCVTVCTEGALRQVQPVAPIQLAERKVKTRGMNPSEKRHMHIDRQGQPLAATWKRNA